MLRLSLLAILVLLLATASEVGGQPSARNGNASVKVQIQHPPELSLVAEKVVLAAFGECGTEIIRALSRHFASEGLDVIDGEELDRILGEHDFSFNGDVDQKSTVELGKILGPSALLVIEVTECETVPEQFETSTKVRFFGLEVPVPVYVAKMNVLLTLRVQTVDLTTGRIFDVKPFEYSPSLKNETNTGTGTYPEYPSEFEVRNIAFEGVVSDISPMLLPWTQEKDLVFFDNKKCNLKAAYQALKNGEKERALALSLENLDTCKNDPKMKEKKRQKILANAYYNVGLMHRMRGELDVALEYLLEAERLRPVEIMAEAVADCREAVQARDAMQGIREEAQQAALDFQERLAAEEQARRDNTLTNSGVIALVKMGLPEAIIVKKIETSLCEFDVSPEALVGLTEAGVGQTVILSMMESGNSDAGR